MKSQFEYYTLLVFVSIRTVSISTGLFMSSTVMNAAFLGFEYYQLLTKTETQNATENPTFSSIDIQCKIVDKLSNGNGQILPVAYN